MPIAIGGMSSSASTNASPQMKRMQKQRQEYADHRGAAEILQADLRRHAAALSSKDGWDAELEAGVQEWVDDIGNIWRILRKMEYDMDKAHDILVASLSHRIQRRLDRPVPTSNPVARTPFQYILPLSQFTDRLGRPILVLSPRAIARDENGSLHDMEEWVWWVMEMMRRLLRDWWVQGGGWDNVPAGSKGFQMERSVYKGDGCVMVVDVSGAGLRNIDLELQAAMKTVSHEGFPGMTDGIYVANAGWTARSLWGGIKRLLPVSSLEKVHFLDSRKTVEEFFDPSRFPKSLGGDVPHEHDLASNPAFIRYSREPAAA